MATRTTTRISIHIWNLPITITTTRAAHRSGP